MEIVFTQRARKEFGKLGPEEKAAVRKQAALLQQDIRYPSLDAKKYGGVNDVWQGRVNKNYRFYFQIVGNIYLIISIIPHPK